MVVAYVLLSLAIVAEVVGTLALKMSEGFTKVVPTIFVFVGYLTAFASLGLGLSKGLSMGVAYGIWAGAGTALVAIMGIFLFKESLNVWGFVGIALIIVGVVMLEMGSSHN
jgi:small multidrug resistance pump